MPYIEYANNLTTCTDCGAAVPVVGQGNHNRFHAQYPLAEPEPDDESES